MSDSTVRGSPVQRDVEGYLRAHRQYFPVASTSAPPALASPEDSVDGEPVLLSSTESDASVICLPSPPVLTVSSSPSVLTISSDSFVLPSSEDSLTSGPTTGASESSPELRSWSSSGSFRLGPGHQRHRVEPDRATQPPRTARLFARMKIRRFYASGAE